MNAWANNLSKGRLLGTRQPSSVCKRDQRVGQWSDVVSIPVAVKYKIDMSSTAMQPRNGMKSLFLLASHLSSSRIFLQLIIIIAICIAGNCFASDTESFLQYKSFLAATPIIKSIIFERDMTQYQTGKPGTMKLELYSGTWQSNAFLLKRLSRIEQATNDVPPKQYKFNFGESVVCNLNNRSWILENFLKKCEDSSLTNDVTIQANSYKHIFSEVLMLGSPIISIGSLRWTSDREFVARSYSGSLIVGKISLNESGQPVKMTYKCDSYKDTQFTFNYLFDTNISFFLPSEITATGELNGKLFSLPKIKLLKVEIVETNLPDMFYGENRFCDLKAIPTLVFDKKTVFAESGSWKKAVVTSQVSRADGKIVRIIVIITLVFFAIILPAVILVWYAAKKTKTKTKTKTKKGKP
jgi:hypothetical protein